MVGKVRGVTPWRASLQVCAPHGSAGLGARGRGVVTWWLPEQPGLRGGGLEGEALRGCSLFGEFP